MDSGVVLKKLLENDAPPLHTLPPAVRRDVLQQLFNMEEWQLVLRYARQLCANDSSSRDKDKIKLSFPLQITQRWFAAPCVDMVYAFTLYLEISQAHRKELIKDILYSEKVIALLLDEHFELLLRMLNLYGTLLSKGSYGPVPRIHTLKVFARPGGINVLSLGQTDYVGALRFFPEEVWRASSSSFVTEQEAAATSAVDAVAEEETEYACEEEYVAEVPEYHHHEEEDNLLIHRFSTLASSSEELLEEAVPAPILFADSDEELLLPFSLPPIVPHLTLETEENANIVSYQMPTTPLSPAATCVCASPTPLCASPSFSKKRKSPSVKKMKNDELDALMRKVLCS